MPHETEHEAEALLADPETEENLSLLLPARVVRALLHQFELAAPALEQSLRALLLSECCPLTRWDVEDGQVIIVHDQRWSECSAAQLLEGLRRMGKPHCMVMIVPPGFRMQVTDRETAEAYQVLVGLEEP